MVKKGECFINFRFLCLDLLCFDSSMLLNLPWPVAKEDEKRLYEV